MQPLLIFDCNFICHYKKHAMKNLSYKEQRTGVIYGFLQSVLKYAKHFRSNRMVFVWDSEQSIRRNMDSKYKEKRTKDPTPLEQDLEYLSRPQFKLLRDTILPRIGFQNIFWQNGYEADDVIASIVYEYKEKEFSIVLLANDHDMYQLLDDNVVLCNPTNNAIYGINELIEEWGVHPTEWGQAMGIAGCTTDNVEGVPNVGMKTAIKFIHDELSTSTKAYAAIDQAHKIGWVDKTRKLVVLPLNGTKRFPIQPERLSVSNFMEICNWYNLQSFLKEKTLSSWIEYLELK